MYVRMYVCMHACMGTRVCMCIYVSMYVEPSFLLRFRFKAAQPVVSFRARLRPSRVLPRGTGYPAALTAASSRQSLALAVVDGLAGLMR